MNRGIEAVASPLPAFSALGPEPVLEPAVYEHRVEILRSRMSELGLGAVIVYADREHIANASYLTGFDPRFEEALVVVQPFGLPVVIAGNESISMVEDSPMELRGVLAQSLSLAGQPRATQPRVASALQEARVDASSTIGVIGWRPIDHADSPTGALSVAIPQFILNEILAFSEGRVVDATGLLAGLDGLRSVNQVEQLALNEHRSTRASQHVWRAIEAMRPGVSELDLSAEMRLTGSPLSAHIMLTTGAERANGLRSPTDRIIREGDRLSTAVSLQGGLTARAGRVIDSGHAEFEQTLEFVSTYWRAITTWYESLTLGTPTGEIVASVREVLAAGGIRPMLNPGHLQHLDEWLDSPFVPGSARRLYSGMSLQADIIPVGPTPGFISNAEDALALADSELRDEFADRFPSAWERITKRRTSMIEELGIRLPDEVLPFADRQAMLPPALLEPQTILALR
ncbi:M24 family metallopeptidase [Parafrigoribacterium mesophilum]|uniref:M24 family metallopeptidase n=1 Tax=Parafrigoribacterium mesophilum TaxID=433646 RepID=UPI0031FD3C02